MLSLADEFNDVVSDVVEFQSEALNYFCPDSLVFVEESEQDVFGSDDVVFKLASFFYGVVEDGLCVLSSWQKAIVGVFGALTVGYHFLDKFSCVGQIDVFFFEYFRCEPLLYFDEAEQEVFGSDVVMS